MAMQKRFKVDYHAAFPAGLFLKPSETGLEPVQDFNAPKREDGSRPQQRDKDTGMPLWQGVFLDADDQAGKRDTAISIKFAAEVRPVPPENTSGLPWIPVELVGLTALPYIDESGGRPRIAWSFRAEGMVAPGQARHQSGEAGKAGSGPKAAA